MKIFDNIRTIMLASKKEEPATQAKKRISTGLKRNYQYRIELTLEQFKNAVDASTMIDLYDRKLLLTIYTQAMKDSHLASQIRTAVYSVMQSEFYLSKTNNPDTKATDLLQTGWFDEFVRLALDAEFWGHSLIEFGQLNAEGNFDTVQLIPRLNVRQEVDMVVAEYNDTKGIAYRDAATKLALIEIGEPFDLGLLELATKEVIVKNYARTDWSQASEKYGMPLLKILTESQDDKEIDRMEDMAANFASNGYVILNREDDAEIISAKNTDFHQIYKENIALCDQQISKIINGQTGTSDEKAFVGSAEVHERILNDYTRNRLRRMQHTINNKLLPFLVFWGYPLDGYKFYYTDLQKKPDPEPMDGTEGNSHHSEGAGGGKNNPNSPAAESRQRRDRSQKKLNFTFEDFFG